MKLQPLVFHSAGTTGWKMEWRSATGRGHFFVEHVPAQVLGDGLLCWKTTLGGFRPRGIHWRHERSPPRCSRPRPWTTGPRRGTCRTCGRGKITLGRFSTTRNPLAPRTVTSDSTICLRHLSTVRYSNFSFVSGVASHSRQSLSESQAGHSCASSKFTGWKARRRTCPTPSWTSTTSGCRKTFNDNEPSSSANRQRRRTWRSPSPT